MSFAKHLGEALKLLRSRRGWPQKQLAAAARITRGMVSNYESGKQAPTLATLDRILAALKADLCDLYCAIEFVNGRQLPVHELSAQFQPGQARSLQVAARNPPGPRATADEPGEHQGEPRLPESVETALSDAMASIHLLVRFALLAAGKPR